MVHRQLRGRPRRRGAVPPGRCIQQAQRAAWSCPPRCHRRRRTRGRRSTSCTQHGLPLGRKHVPLPSSDKETGSLGGTRMVMCGPPSTSGGSIACSRAPDGSCPSTHGLASSRRRPAMPASRTASPRASAASSRSPTSSMPRPRSTQMRPSPLTATSVTPGSASHGSRGPAPSTRDASADLVSATRWAPRAPRSWRGHSVDRGAIGRRRRRGRAATQRGVRVPPGRGSTLMRRRPGR